ncbi:urease accessory protein UreD [Aurantimonas marianensis]|uniref:Urease accessory protein UreD n=1 Tax=Aurantimonas marianensis TaxID=2920428 RepID=A0A9X2H4I9_9HYPH|nr:urease accessory protein UreD [Aurantimonas marianensis]MCP3053630.1 urease accessory protein UreD [Aurantimonas marianensis]
MLQAQDMQTHRPQTRVNRPPASPSLPAEAGRVVPMQRAAGSATAEFQVIEGRTRLKRLHQSGCLKLRFPRLPRPEAEAILINTSGGLTGGDRIDQAFTVSDCASLTVTTQACERVYRAAEGHAAVATRIAVGPEARFYWLPQETILFDGGAVRRALELEATESSRFLLCESVILGRERMGETVETGMFRDRWRVRVGGRLVFADDLLLDGAIGERAKRAASLAGNRAFATLVAQGPGVECGLNDIRAIIGEAGGASLVDGLLVARIMAPSGFLLRKRLVPLLSALANGPLPLVWSL